MTTMPGFSPIRSYDVPEVLLSQLVDGRLSASTARNTVWEAIGGPPRLGIAERSGFAERLGEMQNPLTQALVNVATNPLSYLVLLAGAPAGKIAGGLFKVAPKYSAAVMDRAPFLHMVGLGTGKHLTRGTPLAGFVDDFKRGLEEWRGVMQGDNVTRSLDKLLKTNKKLGLTEADLTADPALFTGEKARFLEDLNNLISARMRGLNKTVNQVDLVADEAGNFTTRTSAIKPLLNVADEEITGRLTAMGADDLVQAMMDNRKRAFEMLFLKADGTVDGMKVARIHNARRFPDSGMMEHGGRGDKAIAQLFGREIDEAIAAGTLDEKKFIELVEGTYGEVLKGNSEFYLPRNTFRAVSHRNGDEFVEAVEAQRRHNEDTILEVGGALKGRNEVQHVMDPSDLRSLRNTFTGQTNEDILKKHLGRAYLHVDEVAKKPGQNIAYLERFRPFQQMSRYYETAGRSYALFSRAPSKATLEYQAAQLAALRNSDKAEKILNRGGKLRGPSGKFDDGENLLTDFATAKNAPIGGFTVADGIDQTYQLIPATNTAARKFMKEMLVPSIMGRAGVKDSAGAAYKAFTQGVAESFMETDIGKMLRNSKNKNLKAIATAMDDYASSELPKGGSFSGNIARWLYTTHLGLNMGSVLQNMTQPIVTTARWVPARDMVTGYKNALGQLTNYWQDRLKYGIHMDAKAAERLHQKHFRLFNEMGLTGNAAFEMLDSALQRSGMFTGAAGRFGRVNKMQEIMMGPFQHAEIFNRLVTAEAVAAKNIRLGRRLSDGVVRQEIAQAVQESQFGADLLNTPSAFMSPNNPLSNPILKQFLQFPSRMFVAPFEVGAVAGSNEVALYGIAKDVMRGVGISAIGYETFKAFDVDASRVGFLESTTQLIGGVVDDRDGPIPIPPAIQIAAETSKFLTGEDNEFFKYTLPRVIPGGLAFARATQGLPDLSGGNPTLSEFTPQRRYADWKNMRDGYVPVFDYHGRYIGDEHAATQLARATGLDLTGFQRDTEIEQFMLQQSEQARSFKDELKRRVYANDYNGARELQAKFQEKFGYSLVLSRSDIMNMQKMRNVPRAERILERTPEGMRDEMSKLLFDYRGPERLNFSGTEDQYTAAQNAQGREELRRFQTRVNPEDLPPELLEQR
jgi:hypothetical protein